ncbi:MAG: hypothetical protein WD535_03305, partial [Thermaerobacterales bacterium]
MSTLAEVFALLLTDCAPLGSETVGVQASLGRVAARGVWASDPLPGFHRAMMDGYVCHSLDLHVAAGPPAARLTVTGPDRPVPAGHVG